jgi:flagellar biosynthesis protein FlhA
VPTPQAQSQKSLFASFSSEKEALNLASFSDNLASLKRLRVGTDIGLALGVVFILSMLILPLPPFLLDVGLSLSFTSGVLVLMVALFVVKPLDFTSFPTILLLTTLLRLALDVAATRQILAHGNEGMLAAGHVIAAFGGFLMGGDIVIGLIVFAILLVVNFIVITKGSTRIAEVAARFALDAIPGKQMAIDAELNSGSINEKTARRRRSELEQESSFYGAMDGAAKFVRGDAIAALIITSINIIGGLAIGVGQHGMAFSDAAADFSTLSIGEGLVSQIPALLVSVAAGIVVAKGGMEGSADAAMVLQLGRNPKPLGLVAAVAAILAVTPGLPFIPFAALAGLAGSAAYFRYKYPTVSGSTEEMPTPIATVLEPPITDALKMDQIRLELGYGLLALAGGDTPRLTEQVKALRRSIATEMGFILPPVRIQDNMQLPAEIYSVRIKEIEAGRGELRANKLLVMSPNGKLDGLQGERTQEPAFGLPALWVEQDQKANFLAKGCTVVDPASVLTTHLTELVKESMADLLSYAETQKLLDDLPREQQKLLGDMVPSQISVGGIQRVLQALLGERISIRDLPTILESIQEACANQSKTIPAIAAHVRTKLARQISDSLMGANGYLPLIVLSNEWETEFSEALVGPPEARQLALSPARMQDFMRRFGQAYEEAAASGDTPALLTSNAIRQHVRAVIERVRPSVPVLAQTEIFARARIRTLSTI